MPAPRAAVAVLVAAAVAMSACTTLTQSDLAKRDEYLPAVVLDRSGKPDEALRVFPAKEPGGFVTTLERGWLGVQSGTADPAPLVAVGRDLEERKTLFVTQEAKSYFYKQTDDGYLPAEHEAVALHIVTGFAFAQKGDAVGAATEARKASFYLEANYGSQPGFDDPALRTWLAALWAYCGDWESARVDLRRVVEMDPKAVWAQKLASRMTPPKQLLLATAGAGPEVVWHPEITGVTGLQQIEFVPSIKPTTYRVDKTWLTDPVPATPWYARHQQRDRAIRQVLGDSRYVAEGLVPAGTAAVLMAAGTTLGVTIILASVAGAIGVVYGGIMVAKAMPGDAGGYVLGGSFLGAAVVVYFGIKAGASAISGSKGVADSVVDKGFNPTRSYRYVRFLPDDVYLTEAEGLPDDAPLTTNEGETFAPYLSGGFATTHVLAYAPMGSKSEIRDAPLLGTWVDFAHHRDWLYAGRAYDSAHAADFCDRLPGAWRQPTWEEILDARQDGLVNPEQAPVIAPRLKYAVQIWTAGEGHQPGQCRYVDTKDFSEGPAQDCATPRMVLCVRTLTEN